MTGLTSWDAMPSRKQKNWAAGGAICTVGFRCPGSCRSEGDGSHDATLERTGSNSKPLLQVKSWDLLSLGRGFSQLYIRDVGQLDNRPCRCLRRRSSSSARRFPSRAAEPSRSLSGELYCVCMYRSSGTHQFGHCTVHFEG